MFQCESPVKTGSALWSFLNQLDTRSLVSTICRYLSTFGTVFLDDGARLPFFIDRIWLKPRDDGLFWVMVDIHQSEYSGETIALRVATISQEVIPPGLERVAADRIHELNRVPQISYLISPSYRIGRWQIANQKDGSQRVACDLVYLGRWTMKDFARIFAQITSEASRGINEMYFLVDDPIRILS